MIGLQNVVRVVVLLGAGKRSQSRCAATKHIQTIVVQVPLWRVSMDAPAGKRARSLSVAALKAQLPYVSQSALAALLMAAKNNELPDITTRHMLRKARESYVAQLTPYGTIHQELSFGDNITVQVQHPFAMLHHCAKVSKSFSSLLQQCLSESRSTPASPWNIIYYLDEVSPGNQLAYTHLRKSWVVYWSFMELGPALSSEDAHTDKPKHAHTYNRQAHTHARMRTETRTRGSNVR